MDKSTLRVADLMSTDVSILHRNDKLKLAVQVMMDKAIRHLPVFDDWDKLCGIVSNRDVFRGALLKSLGYGEYLEDKILDTVLVKEAMVTDLITTRPDTPIQQAAQTMIEHKIGCLPVVNDDELQGILTEGDFVRLVAEDDS